MTVGRAGFLVLTAITMAAGLLVHGTGAPLATAARDVLGDSLWAAMIAFGIGAIAPRAPLATRCAVAYAVCVSVEVSQLYHASALDAWRETPLGHLVLGSGFDPRDFAAYAGGVAGAALLELAIGRRRPRPRSAR